MKTWEWQEIKKGMTLYEIWCHLMHRWLLVSYNLY